MNNSGGFYVNSRNNLAASVRMVCGSIINDGDWAFNSMTAHLASRYKVTTFGRFVNSGNMWFGTVSSSFNPFSPFEVSSYTDWRNDGLMYFSTSSGSASEVILDHLAGNGVSRIHNNGNICLQNSFFSQRTRISGSGCINALANGIIRLQASHMNIVGAFDANQWITLEDSTSILEIFGLSSVIFHETPIINLAGFGNGNKIRISSTFTSFSYDENRGHLILQLTPIMRLTFNIGSGYTSFITNRAFGFSSEIWTQESPPNDVPDFCSCEDFPESPSDW